MVFVAILSHGRYSDEVVKVPDVKVPYNIRLITYTHPTKSIGAYECDYILKQVLDKHSLLVPLVTEEKVEGKHFNFTLKPELLTMDETNIEFKIVSPPNIKIIAKSVAYLNDKRVIGDVFESEGKFKLFQPNTKTPNIEIEFINDVIIMNSGQYSEPKMVRQTRTGSELVLKYYRNKSFKKSIGYFLKELSCFYEQEFPGKIINVLQLSCRSDHKFDYQSVDELADDLANRCSLEEKIVNKEGKLARVDYRVQLHGFKRCDYSEKLYSNPADFEYIFKNPPLILKKSENIDVPSSTDCFEPNAFENYKIGGVCRRSKQRTCKQRTCKRKQRRTKKHKRSQSKRKLNHRKLLDYKGKLL